MKLELYCFVLSDRPTQIFPVQVAPSDSVGTLKKAIKGEKKAFEDIDADSLNLWKVSIPINVDGSLEENPSDFNFDEGSLPPSTRLSKVFMDGLEEGQLHIVVQPPHHCEYR